jgi:hypothetical protein
MQRSCDKTIDIGYGKALMKRIVLIVCLGSLLGCSSSDDDDGANDTDGGKAGAPQAGKGGGADEADAATSGATSTDVVGHINVKLTPPIEATPTSEARAGSTTVSGKVYDAPLPSATVWDVVAEAGDCKLSTPRAPFCDPACTGGVCVEDDQCEPNPTAHSLGTLHVTGLQTTAGATEFDIEPINNNYMNPADASLPYPAFEEGDAIAFASSGGDYAPITATLAGIAPLALDDAASYDLAKDAPLSLKWSAPAAGGASRVAVQLDISHHGGSKGKIECDTADDGSLDVDASLIGKLIDLGVAGFPTVIVTRSASTTAQIAPGLVEFEVSMARERSVSVPGLSSCTSDGDCDGGKKCQTDLTCQ